MSHSQLLLRCCCLSLSHHNDCRLHEALGPLDLRVGRSWRGSWSGWCVEHVGVLNRLVATFGMPAAAAYSRPESAPTETP